MIPLVGASLLAGLVGSPHCVGMCGPLAAAGSARSVAGMVAWQSGRLGAYAALGALAGSFGLPRLGWPGAVLAALLLVAFAAKLAGVGPRLSLPWASGRVGGALAGAARRLTSPAATGPAALASRAALGALTAFLPCGLLWSAVAIAVAAGSAGLGATAMTAFWLGSAPLLVVASAGVRSLAARGPWLKKGLAMGVLVAGLWSIYSRAALPREGDGTLSDGQRPHCACAPEVP